MLRPIKIQKHMNDILIIITCFIRLMPCFASDMLCVDFFIMDLMLLYLKLMYKKAT